jgi:hypothetical protein
MKLLGYLLAGVLLAGSSASAQVTSPSPLMPSTDVTYMAVNSTAAPESDAASLSSERPSAPRPQRSVVNVFQSYSFQVYLGYTFLRFYEAPGLTQSRNGFDTSAVYYYKAGTIGLDGSLLGAFGSQSPYSSKFAFVGGGPRYRWSAPRNVDLWVHGLVGRSHYTPQTAFGKQGAFGYEIGGGVDVNAHHQRLAYRFEANMIGTRFFGTDQVSPMGAAGIVWKF